MNNTRKAIFLGIVSALFFAVTFVLNRAMSTAGGSWIWAAAFRYYWMVLLLFPLLLGRGQLRELFTVMRKNLGAWLLWSSIGFGIFYAGLTYAASFAPAWLVAGTWQLTIIAGICLAPFLQQHAQAISAKTWFFSLIIIAGVILLQIPEAQHLSWPLFLSSTIPVLLAAFAYPLGNRKMMQLTAGKLSTLQRLFGMTLASLPFWLVLSVYAGLNHPAPSTSLVTQTFIVALFSGVIATFLFFKATEMVRKDEKSLAAVEATQSTEVIFTLFGEVLILHSLFPSSLSLIGMAVIILGMLLHSFKS